MIQTKFTEITSLNNSFLQKYEVGIDILRLDKIHEQISGNKYYKLKYNIDYALQLKKNGILSYGGAYSNHLYALAYYGHLKNIRTVGIIRGEEIENDTLNDCKRWGMELVFVTREEYTAFKNTHYLPSEIRNRYENYFILPEGGANELGIMGCKEILNNTALENYDMLAVSVGTATTLIGLLETTNNKMLGFTAFKNAAYMYDIIAKHTSNKNFTLIDEYSFGGFGKINEELKTFMIDFKQENNIELDRIYTAKMLFGIYDMIKNNSIKKGEKILAIHTGGLQGNRSIN
jgi:1-aminocyclopropane-1-carboxylate deaminase/D-cysteine desulfhydrase-like pyridoxal-dependent ACC family enzyme